MKIIGKASTGYIKSYIVEITENEICNIAGKTYSSEMKNLDVGAEINISEVWKLLNALKDNKKDINTAIALIDAVSSRLKAKVNLVAIGNKE